MALICSKCNENEFTCSCVDAHPLKSASSSDELLSAAIFSGDNSRELWAEINALNAASSGDDVRDVLYSLGCAMQRLEAKLEKENRR